MTISPKTLSNLLASPRLHHGTLAAGAVLATALLAALAATCHEQVERRERFRAEQRMAPQLVLAAAPREQR